MLNENSNIDKTYIFPNGIELKKDEVKRTLAGEFTMQKFISGYDIASRKSIINHLIEKNNFKSYLEIGVYDGQNFQNINVKFKVGVDPKPLTTNANVLKLTSDQFFEKNKLKFDIIFIDGLHLEYQVDKDIQNSFNCIKKNGIIVMHDCNPPSKFHQRENYEVDGKFPPWNGTTWKSFAKLRMNDVNLSMFCVDCDWGVGIIKKGKQKLYKKINKLSYTLLSNHRKKLINLISVSDFLNKF